MLKDSHNPEFMQNTSFVPEGRIKKLREQHEEQKHPECAPT